MIPYLLIIALFGSFCLWLGYRILEKAGFDGWWTLVLLIPVINIIMIWYFAFNHWPNFPSGIAEDLE